MAILAKCNSSNNATSVNTAHSLVQLDVTQWTGKSDYSKIQVFWDVTSSRLVLTNVCCLALKMNRHTFYMVCRTDTLLEREQTHRVTLPDNWHSSLLHHRTLGTRHPLPPHGILVLHQIIYDYLILYTYIYCQDARDLDIIVFCFFGFLVFLDFLWFLVCCCILYSTSLSSYVQPDDGHYGRNM